MCGSSIGLSGRTGAVGFTGPTGATGPPGAPGKRRKRQTGCPGELQQQRCVAYEYYIHFLLSPASSHFILALFLSTCVLSYS